MHLQFFTENISGGFKTITGIIVHMTFLAK